MVLSIEFVSTWRAAWAQRPARCARYEIVRGTTEFSHRVRVDASMDPDWRPISLLARKTISLGTLRMLKRVAGAGSSEVFSLAKRSLGSSCRAVAS
jgi:hypothetical protein